jgi:hypothetical protein
MNDQAMVWTTEKSCFKSGRGEIFTSFSKFQTRRVAHTASHSTFTVVFISSFIWLCALVVYNDVWPGYCLKISNVMRPHEIGHSYSENGGNMFFRKSVYYLP